MPHIEVRDVSLTYSTPSGTVPGVERVSFDMARFHMNTAIAAVDLLRRRGADWRRRHRRERDPRLRADPLGQRELRRHPDHRDELARSARVIGYL